MCGPARAAPLVRRRCLSSVPDAKPARDRFSIVGSSREGRAVYLDSQATMPLDLRVLDAMLPYMTQMYGNPHSRTQAYGWESADVVEESRAKVALLIGADAKEIIFTSGATESNNMAIKVVARTRHPADRGDRQALPLQGRLLPRRWRAGGGQDPGGRQGAQHRPDVALSAHAVIWPQGHRRALRPAPAARPAPIFSGGGQERGMRSGARRTVTLVGTRQLVAGRCF